MTTILGARYAHLIPRVDDADTVPEWQKLESIRAQKARDNMARQRADRLYTEPKGNI
jgi:hypothetical protein